MDHKIEMFAAYREKWMVDLECDRPGCKVAIVINGGLKSHRNIWGAKTCAVRVFIEAKFEVVLIIKLVNIQLCQATESVPETERD